MNISNELNRRIPKSSDELSTSKIKEFLLFLQRLTKQEYKVVLELLPDQPLFKGLPSNPPNTGPSADFVDTICYHSIYNYTWHAPATEVIDVLRARVYTNPENGLRRLYKMMSETARARLLGELWALEVSDSRAYLESLFKGDRPGMIDIALEEALKALVIKKMESILKGDQPGKIDIELETALQALEKKKTAPAYVLEGVLAHRKYRDELIFKAIQIQRRNDPNRLPSNISKANDVRFIVEEINRELFVYQPLNKTKAFDLIWRVLNWYDGSEIPRRRNVEYSMEIGGLFSDLLHTARLIKGGGRTKEFWDFYILPKLRDEQFWHNLSGINKDIPIEETEMYSRLQAAKRGAALTGAIFLGPIVVAGAIVVAIRAPGAVIQLFRWIGGRLLLATQYAHSTYKVYGAVAGTAKIAKDVYVRVHVYYLSNPIVINTRIEAVTEFILDVAGSGTGLAPGSSPADISAAAQKLSKITGRKGISELAKEAKTLTKGHEAEVELVRFMVTASDGKLYKVVGKVAEGEGGKIKAVKESISAAVDNFDSKSQKTLEFFNKPKDASAIIQDTRGLKPTTAVQAGADDAKVTAKTTDNRSVTDAAKATHDKGLVAPATKDKGKLGTDKPTLPPTKGLQPPPKKTPYINDPHNMRPDATNFDRRTAGAGGIDSISFLKDPDGRYSVKITGTLQEGLYRGKGPAPPGKIKAPNYNRSSKFVSNKEAGLDAEWENSHLWGPGFGDEAAAGMMKAPKKVNQWYQNEGVEGWMRDLRKIAAKEGGTVEVEATAIAWDLAGRKWQPKTQVDFLKRAEYRVKLKMPNQPAQPVRMTIDVAPPPGTNVVITIDPPTAANPASLFSVSKAP